MIAAAITLGLAAAWLTRGRMAAQEVAVPLLRPTPGYVVQSTGNAYPTLAAALAAACDGDTVVVRIDGLDRTDPVTGKGKA